MASQKVRFVKCPKCLKILQEDEDVPVYQCGGCSTILQAKRRNIAPDSIPSGGETERVQASDPQTNNVSTSSRQETVLPSSPERSPGQDGSMESMEKQLGGLELSNGDVTNEIQEEECDSEENEGEDNSSFEPDMMKAAGSGASSGSLRVDRVVAAGSEDSSGSLRVDRVVAAGSEDSSGSLRVDRVVTAESGASSGSLSVDRVVAARASDSSGNAEISPDASPVEETQNQIDSFANKNSSAYDGSESSSGEREDDQPFDDENEQWNALQKLRSDRFETQRYPGYKEQGASSSSSFFEERRNGTNWSLQLEGPGGRLGRQGRRHVTEQLRPDVPFYPRDPYTRVSSSYPLQDEFDRYSRAQSLQMPPYGGGMNQESVDYMYTNTTRARGRGQGSRFSHIPFSEGMASDRRNHPGWYSGQLHHNAYSSYSASPQRQMEQPEYPLRWSREIVSDAEDHQRNRHPGYRRELQRQRVAKRHVRPTAGGAPFVSCYRCSANLQLPVDFLIFKRKHHLLRCGTCTTVLRFSLQSKTHLVPAVTNDISANRSSNLTSESPRDKAPYKPEKRGSYVQEEELPVARGSPLHRLMGYSTVSQVFKASQRPPSV